jgi:hypothetical protein
LTALHIRLEKDTIKISPAALIEKPILAIADNDG